MAVSGYGTTPQKTQILFPSSPQKLIFFYEKFVRSFVEKYLFYASVTLRDLCLSFMVQFVHLMSKSYYPAYEDQWRYILGWVKSFAIFWYVLVCHHVTEAIKAMKGSRWG